MQWLSRRALGASKSLQGHLIAPMENGVISNYKYYEDDINPKNSGHFYEITVTEEEKCYYVQSQKGDGLAYGTDVKINPPSKMAFINNLIYPIMGPFEKVLNIINYQGFVIDFIDSDIGLYNLDNEIFLLGSACLELPVGVNVTLFNLHLVRLDDISWFLEIYGKRFMKSTHILVYCPAFSSYLEGSENVSYDNFISTKSNLSSLLYSNKWVKDNLKVEIPDFQSLDDLATILCSGNQSQGAIFLGHCEKCTFAQNLTELNGSRQSKKLVTAQDVKDSFHKIKNEIKENSVDDNKFLRKYQWMKNEIVQGVIKRTNSVLFEVKSGDKTVQIYSNESNGFNPPDNTFVLIFDAIQIVEIVPKLKTRNSQTVKAYLWISPETKIWSPADYFWTPSLDFSCPAGYIPCKILRKYLILQDFNQQQCETTVIHIESEKGPHSFYLNPNEKYYGIISSTDETDEGILSMRHFIKEDYFKESKEAVFLPSSGIFPTLSCNIKVDERSPLKGPLQLRINDLPYLSLIKSLHFFSLKLRFYSISSLSLRLICSKCKSQVESGRCLVHSEDFSPVLIVSAVFETADMDGTPATVLIDRFSFFEKLLGAHTTFKNTLINLLKYPGKVKMNSAYFSFMTNLKSPVNDQKPTIESLIANVIPRVSRIMNCTFPSNMANSVLKPVNLEYCDPKLELINILKLF